jgi:hypothetical protein
VPQQRHEGGAGAKLRGTVKAVSWSEATAGCRSKKDQRAPIHCDVFNRNGDRQHSTHPGT